MLADFTAALMYMTFQEQLGYDYKRDTIQEASEGKRRERGRGNNKDYTGIFITAGTLPLIVYVVFFSKTYVFSILLCVFYSVLNMSATALFDALPKTILWILPTPLTTFWSAGDMAEHGIKMDLEQMTGLIPSTFQVVIILGIMAVLSFFVIDRLYKQRGE